MTYIKRYIEYICHVKKEMFSIKKMSTTLLSGSAAMQIFVLWFFVHFFLAARSLLKSMKGCAFHVINRHHNYLMQLLQKSD